MTAEPEPVSKGGALAKLGKFKTSTQARSENSEITLDREKDIQHKEQQHGQYDWQNPDLLGATTKRTAAKAQSKIPRK